MTEKRKSEDFCPAPTIEGEKAVLVRKLEAAEVRKEALLAALDGIERYIKLRRQELNGLDLESDFRSEPEVRTGQTHRILTIDLL